MERQTIEQTMEVMPNGTRRLAVQLRTPLPSSLLWSVLTDYDQLSEFIPNLSRSTLISRTGNTVMLSQVGTQKLMGLRFTAQVELELTEDPEHSLLKFHLLKGDFRRFEGSWRMTELSEGTSLLYELTVQGCVGMPISLIEQRLREDLSANLLAVENEALRRNSLG